MWENVVIHSLHIEYRQLKVFESFSAWLTCVSARDDPAGRNVRPAPRSLGSCRPGRAHSRRTADPPSGSCGNFWRRSTHFQAKKNDKKPEFISKLLAILLTAVYIYMHTSHGFSSIDIFVGHESIATRKSLRNTNKSFFNAATVYGFLQYVWIC